MAYRPLRGFRMPEKVFARSTVDVREVREGESGNLRPFLSLDPKIHDMPFQ